jgi:WD40 repeat protein
MLDPSMFATGGTKNDVRLWTVNEDLSSVLQTRIAVDHSSHLLALLPLRDTSRKLLTAGADGRINVWDLSSERIVQIINVSHHVYNLYNTPMPYCVLAEVSHPPVLLQVIHSRGRALTLPPRLHITSNNMNYGTID